jgi:hypothetical protein
VPRRIKILFNVTSGNGVDLLCLIRSRSGSLNYFRNLHVFLLFSLTTHLKLFFLFLFLFFIIANNILKEIRVIVRVCEKTHKTKQFCLTKKSQKLTVGLRKLYFPLNFRWTSSPKSACHSWKLGWHKWEKETLCYGLCLYVFICWGFFSLLLPQGFFPSRECHKNKNDLKAAPRRRWRPRCELGNGFFCCEENEKESLSGRKSPSQKMTQKMLRCLTQGLVLISEGNFSPMVMGF